MPESTEKDGERLVRLGRDLKGHSKVVTWCKSPGEVKTV